MTTISKNLDYAEGFRDARETEESKLSWEGTPPDWLRGSLFRNGPGRYDRGKVEVEHWFDGLAQLHAFRITPEEVKYSSRFVRSHDFRTAEQDGTIASPGFMCDPCRSLFRKVASAFVVDATDNPCISLVKQGDEFLALTEIPIPMQIDPETLHSKFPLVYRDKVPPGSTTAHPHQEGPYLFNQVLHYSALSSYRLYSQRNLEAREEFARVPVNEVSYVHSFGLSPDHFILTCCPFQVPPWKLLVRDKPFILNFQWKPGEGTRFHVTGRPHAPSSVRTLTTEPFFTFHHVNSFLHTDGDLRVDLVAYPTADIIHQLTLERLRNNQRIDFGRLRRYRLDQGNYRIEREWESDHVMELPRINYKQKNTRPYRFVYGVSADPKTSHFYDRLLKLEVESDAGKYWHEPNTYPGEPVFVPAPNAAKEDNGVVLSVILCEEQNRSFLLVLDASTFQERARAWLPEVVPHGFHGLFEPEA